MSETPTRSAFLDGADVYESFSERLLGLTEMLPPWTTVLAEQVADRSSKGAKAVYRYMCLLTWVGFSASMMLLAPVVFETERNFIEERRMDDERNRIREDVMRKINVSQPM